MGQTGPLAAARVGGERAGAETLGGKGRAWGGQPTPADGLCLSLSIYLSIYLSISLSPGFRHQAESAYSVFVGIAQGADRRGSKVDKALGAWVQSW